MNWLKRKLMVAYLTPFKFPPLLWLVAARMEAHRAAKLEQKLMECYRKVPRLHYDNCSDYAREQLFHPPGPDGWVEYIDDSVQTCEPPF